MSDAPDKDKKPAVEEPAGAAKASKGGMLVPLIAAALISVGGSFGVGFFLNKQLLNGINKELSLTLAQVGAAEEQGDAHAPTKDAKSASNGHGPLAMERMLPTPSLPRTIDTRLHPITEPPRRRLMQQAVMMHQSPKMMGMEGLRLKRKPPKKSPKLPRSKQACFRWASTPS